MDVLTLSNTYFNGVSANYSYDPSIDIETQNYISYEGINVSIVDFLSGAKDTSNNYYSNFVLTNKTNVGDKVKIELPIDVYPKSFLTYLGLYTSGEILPKSLTVQTNFTPQLNTVAYTIGFDTYDTDYEYQYYTVNLLDSDRCTITQSISGINYYLSYFQCNTGSSEFLMVYEYQNDEVNIFNYLYDTVKNQLVLYKLVNGEQKYVSYDTTNNWLTLTGFISGSDIFNTSCALKTRSYNNYNPILPSDWYSYTQIIDLDNLNVNNDRSVDNVKLNYILNFTNEKVDNNTIPVNILPLKNDKDDKNSLSRGNIINQNVDGVIQRDYTSLNTGTNQLRGSPDFNNTYSATTTQLLVKSDNITFFYFPYESFPIIKLNINDSSLVNSGCIAGDTPINSDKVFKHKTLEYFSIPFNTNNSETTGAYLCSWLKGGNSLSAEPVWVDRYYNPSVVSGVDALSFTINSNYTTNFTQVSTANNVNSNYPVYDVLSNLTFEPGIQYAIQHLGEKNIIQLIDSLSANVVQKYFTTVYDYLNQPYDNLSNEIVLGPTYYSKFLDSTQFTAIKDFNNFTINFDLYANDWSKPLGYQIFGNYNNYGLGVFNYQHVTPFVVSYNKNTIFCYNTDLKLLDSISLGNTTIKYVNKLDPVGNTIAITSDNYVTLISYNSVIVDKKIIPDINLYTQFYSTLEYTYCYTNTLPPLKIDNITLDYEEISSTNTISIPGKVGTLSYINTLISYKDILYTVPGINVKILDNKIFFISSDDTIQNLCSYDISTSTLTVIYECTLINDYVVNENGALYVVFDNNKLLLSDEFYNIKTSNGFPVKLFTDQPSLSGVVVQSIDYIRNFNSNGIADEGLVFGVYDPANVKTVLVRTNKIVSNTINVFNTIDFNNTIGICAPNLSNYNFTLSNLNGEGKFEFRLGLPNIFNNTDVLLVRNVIEVSTLEPGYHNFVIRFDSVNGVYSIFIDGREVNQTLVPSGQYSFSNILNIPFMAGNCIYYNNFTLGSYIDKPNYYFTTPLPFKNLYIYNTALSYYNMLLHLRQNYPISDVKFQLPVNKRNFVETIQQFFMFKVPGAKSNYFNVEVVDLPVSATLEEILNVSFIDVINKNKPSCSELNTITYHE